MVHISCRYSSQTREVEHESSAVLEISFKSSWTKAPEISAILLPLYWRCTSYCMQRCVIVDHFYASFCLYNKWCNYSCDWLLLLLRSQGYDPGLVNPYLPKVLENLGALVYEEIENEGQVYFSITAVVSSHGEKLALKQVSNPKVIGISVMGRFSQ